MDAVYTCKFHCAEDDDNIAMWASYLSSESKQSQVRYKSVGLCLACAILGRVCAVPRMIDEVEPKERKILARRWGRYGKPLAYMGNASERERELYE
jgi:hypothetical protein